MPRKKTGYPCTLIIDEWAERNIDLYDPQAYDHFSQSCRQAQRSIALVADQKLAELVTRFYIRMMLAFPQFHRAFLARRVRMKLFTNPRQFIIQFSWYASQHPFHHPV